MHAAVDVVSLRRLLGMGVVGSAARLAGVDVDAVVDVDVDAASDDVATF